MFAPPPPPPLSRAEIERRLAAHRAERGIAAGNDQRASSPSKSQASTRQQYNVMSTQRNRRHHQAVMLRSSPPRTPPPRTPPPRAPHESVDRRAAGSPLQRQDAVRRTLPVFEEPRRAPIPPKRPPRPPSELFLPPPPPPINIALLAAFREDILLTRSRLGGAVDERISEPG